MSKEQEALEEYMQQQQKRINELTQAMVLLQTRNAILEKELITARGYVMRPQGPIRDSIAYVKTQETDTRVPPPPKKQSITKFTTSQQKPEKPAVPKEPKISIDSFSIKK